MNTVVDSLGNEFYDGALIMYPGRRGSSLWMSYAVVERIVPVVNWRGEQSFVLKVSVVSKNWSGTVVGLRKTTLRVLNRVTIVHPIMFNAGKYHWHSVLINARNAIIEKRNPTANTSYQETKP